MPTSWLAAFPSRLGDQIMSYSDERELKDLEELLPGDWVRSLNVAVAAAGDGAVLRGVVGQGVPQGRLPASPPIDIAAFRLAGVAPNRLAWPLAEALLDESVAQIPASHADERVVGGRETIVLRHGNEPFRLYVYAFEDVFFLLNTAQESTAVDVLARLPPGGVTP